MKNFWNISLFKIAILTCLSLFTNNILIYILSILYLVINKKYKDLILYLLIIILSLTLSSINISFINIGVVDSKTSEKTCVVDNVFYRTKLSNCEGLNIGDIVYFNGSSVKTEDINNLKKNILYTNSNEVSKLYTLRIRSFINEKINSFSDETKGYLKSILLNEYNDQDTTISFGFCFYYIFMFLNRKYKKISYISLIAYILLFGFEIKLILIFTTIITSYFELSRINKIGFKVLMILIINKYLLINYSILVTLLISLIYSLEHNQMFYISLMQSLLFNYINPLMSFLYKYVIISRIISFILAITLIFIPTIEVIFLSYIKVLSFIMNLLTIEIRGKLSIISLLIIFIVIKLFNIKNEYLKIIIVILMLITPINNPFAKVSFIDVGQGDSILIKDKFSSGNILIDTGSEYNYYKLKRYLYSQGIYKIDKLIISHSDSDHNGNIENLKKDFKIQEIIDKPQDTNINNIKLMNLYLGKFDNDNDNSLVYYANIYGLNYLFTGDISKNVEKTLISKYPIVVDILKVGHHGSKNSSSEFFISSLLPRFAIISTNGMYSHPHKEVINILKRYEIPTLITKDVGDIEFIYTSITTLIKSADGFVIIKS